MKDDYYKGFKSGFKLGLSKGFEEGVNKAIDSVLKLYENLFVSYINEIKDKGAENECE